MALSLSFYRFVLVGLAAVFITPAAAQFTQQGAKLVGTGGSGAGEQGTSIALSADGNTAIVGAPKDNSNAGAAWVFTRSNGVWTQQGIKLVGSGATGSSQGWSVALSADGNTAIIGGQSDSGGLGAAWVFTRSGGVWTQQGSKLVGSGSVGANVQQGYSVALSGDGNTAIIGGPSDNAGAGAAWVWVRSGGTWSQQGSKLVGSLASGSSQQGFAVAIASDGNTALIGGPVDNSAWAFTRSGSAWSQQGSKLTGSGVAGGQSFQGAALALSQDGNTALIGGPLDNGGAGAAWVFTRSAGVWSQQGSKLVGAGAAGSALQGTSVAISGDGNTSVVGGLTDNNNTGAVWQYRRISGVRSQVGSKFTGSGASGNAQQGQSVALSSDASTALTGGWQDNSSAGATWVFTAPTAQINDLTHPGSTSFQIGDSWQIIVRGAANQTVTVTGMYNGSPWGPITEGTTDGNGNYSLMGTASAGVAGNWIETWYVGGIQANPTLAFTITSTPTAQISNLTRPGNGTSFAVGDNWRVTLIGGSNQAVSVSGTYNGGSWGPLNVGQSDVNGNFSLMGVMPAGTVGNWTEAWYVGGVQANPVLSFSVAPSVQISNLTSPSSTNFNVGDSYRVTVSGTPNRVVSVSGTFNGRGWGPLNEGQTDGNGNYSLTGVMTSGTSGNWTETWFVNGVQAIPVISFTVN